jgi:hypothetical protein
MTLVYKREGFAQTRDALTWAATYAPEFKYGLTLDQVFDGLEHGYLSVRRLIKDAERVQQWEQSRRMLREARDFFNHGNAHQGTQALQQAEELFTALRRIGGKKMSDQQLGDTEHGANEVDED